MALVSGSYSEAVSLLRTGTVFTTDMYWIKDTVSIYEVIIQAELLIAVTAYKCCCIYSIKRAKQIKYF